MASREQRWPRLCRMFQAARILLAAAGRKESETCCVVLAATGLPGSSGYTRCALILAGNDDSGRVSPAFRYRLVVHPAPNKGASYRCTKGPGTRLLITASGLT